CWSPYIARIVQANVQANARTEPDRKSHSPRVAGRGTRPPFSASQLRCDAARQGSVRIRGNAEAHLLPNGLDRLAAVRDEGRRLRGNRRRRQRRRNWRIAIHGWRNDSEPSDRAKRGIGLPAGQEAAQARVQPAWANAAPAVALYAGSNHADGSDRRLQPAPLRESAVVPMVAPVAGSAPVERA